jgi:hypothetical protein
MVMTQASETITIDTLMTAADEAGKLLEGIVSQYGPILDGGPDSGGWTPRQVLSHLVGALQRTPIHVGYFLDGDPSQPVPVMISDPYWIAEWGTAPLASFLLALRAAIEGNKAFLRTLDPAMLSRSRRMTFGEMTLAKYLTVSYVGHMKFHTPQLNAFLQRND